jgi:hypothetical protein
MANPLTTNILLAVFEQKNVSERRCAFSNALRVAATSTIVSVFAGCMTQQQAPVTGTKPVEVAPSAKPTALTQEAEVALNAAEQSVIEARVKRALWTAAVEQLAKAREAAKSFDSNATLTHAKEVVALCTLSLQQLSAPPVKW